MYDTPQWYAVQYNGTIAKLFTDACKVARKALAFLFVVNATVATLLELLLSTAVHGSLSIAPPAVWFTYTPDRKGIHPQQHLEAFNGTLQADAYGGYQAIYETGRITEAACWAHARRQFYELHVARPNALNTEALERIGALYRIEETIRGKPPDERQAYRQEHARPLLDRFHAWLTLTLETLSRKSDTSQAILYAMNR
ncbi:conserved hypothetical protein [Ricinus communis]|uniref:Transposase IS66 central domain-containing protein n=1 Tax=Ricinus communis TaxID=3988 RepID=B9T7I1_RICCO|nr:conserved hypothetical protein [Ricinus communis]